jgi:NTP pyrophosphatase (non-canonical NTP hydrolase)
MRRPAKIVPQLMTVADAVSAAFSIIEELADEVQEVVDNASGTNREYTQRIQTLGDTAETLQNYSEPAVDEKLADIEVTVHLVQKRNPSRGDRRDEACAMLATVIAELGEIEDGNENKELAEDLSSELSDAQDSWESVEFPGMYG